ncbi:S8 family serine peptidase [Actinoplanes sp. HUAS TT8]|uniref:S8 family serine peptidase n=1 Tax=Actinoplanes sp. HUAS TT8 TaxID=3447453 RepID=UPI003F51CCF8
MRKFGLLAGVLVAALLVAPAQAGAAPAGDKVDPRLLLKFASGDRQTFFVDLADRGEPGPAPASSPGRAARVARTTHVYQDRVAHAERTQHGLRELLEARGLDYKTFWIANTIEVTGDFALVRELAARADVGRIALPATAVTVDPLGASASAATELPWGLQQIGADKVWDDYGVRGDGVVVGSLDTGVQFDHPALIRQYRGTAADGTVSHAYNWFDATGTCPEPGVPCDDVGHGTHTTGTMTGDDGAGHTVGVAPGARWIAAKGCQVDGCTEEALLAAGQWMLAPTDANGQNPRPDLSPDIVNNSWGGPEDGSTFYDDIIATWVAAGIFPVFSNGNDGVNGCGTAGYPATNPQVYAVGALDSTGTAAYFSSRGAADDGSTRPDIAAPGVDVLSSRPGGGYGLDSGTSMAAPHVAGAVALLWSANPNLRRDVAATRELLDASAHDADDETCGGDAADNNVYGQGRLDAYALVQAGTAGQHGGITVTVTGAGNPMPEAKVTLASDVVTRTARTGADGTAELGRVPAGDYTLTVSRFAQLTQRRTLTLAAGATQSLDVDLTAPAPWHQVTGVVTDPSGRPVAGASVRLADETFPGFVTGAGGRFTGPLPEGDYDVVVDYGRWLAPRTVALTVDGDETLDVALAAKTDGFGYTVTESRARFTTGGRTVKPGTVRLPEPVTFYGVTYRQVTVHDDGYLTFGDGATVNAFRADLVLDRRSHVTTRAGHDGFAVTWTGALIKGTAKRIDVQILLGRGGAITVRYRNLPAGASALVGIADAKGTNLLSYAQNDPVLKNETAVTFAVPGAGLLRGRVLDANTGRPVVAADVLGTSTDADGGWQVQRPAGPVTGTVGKPAYESAPIVATVAANTVRTADVKLRTPLLTAPASRSVTVRAGGTATVDIPLGNRGGLPATWDAREINSATAPDGEPGKVLGSFGIPDLYNAYGIDWHDGKVLVTDTYFWGQVERFDTGGNLLGRGVIPMNGWASDLTSVPSRGLSCGPSMSIVGDLPIVCFDRDSLQVKATIPTPRAGTLYYGLAYRASDDTFYLAGDGAIRHIAGLGHTTPGEVLGQCVPAVPWTVGLELNEKQNVLWSLNQDNQGERLRALDPDTCAELSWAPDPDPDGLSAAGLTVDDQGDLWTLGQAWTPGQARVYHVSGQLPAYSEIPWLATVNPTGTVTPGGTASVRVTVDTTGLRPGVHRATLLLVSNGATAATVPVTVALTVRK